MASSSSSAITSSSPSAMTSLKEAKDVVKELQAEVKELQAEVKELASDPSKKGSEELAVAKEAWRDARKRLAKAEDHQRALELRAPASSAAGTSDASLPPVTAFGLPSAPAKLDTLIQKVCQPGSGVVWPSVWGDQSRSMMFAEMYRPAVEELLEGARSSTQNCTPFALVNVSGSGKTSALFQLARHSWVCYVTCGTVRASDYSVYGLESDAEFQDLVQYTTGLWQQFLQKHDNAQRAKRRPWELPDYELFVQTVKHRVRIQVLARLLFLLYACTHFKKKPFTATVTAALLGGQRCIHLLVVRLDQLEIRAGQLEQCLALVVEELRNVASLPLFFAVDEAGLGFTSEFLCKCFRGGTSKTSLRSIASPLLQVMNEQQKPFVNIVVAGTERAVNTAEYLGSCLNKTNPGDIREIWDFPPISDPAAVLSQHTSSHLVKECDSKLVSSLAGRPRHVARALDMFNGGPRKDKEALEDAMEASAKKFCEDLSKNISRQGGMKYWEQRLGVFVQSKWIDAPLSRFSKEIHLGVVSIRKSRSGGPSFSLREPLVLRALGKRKRGDRDECSTKRVKCQEQLDRLAPRKLCYH